MAAAADLDVAVQTPGVHPDMPADVYHGDPVPGGSLSSSGARLLLPPSCPALFRHWADTPRTPKREFDFGHIAHWKVLGVGPDVVLVGADDWRTKAARSLRDEAYAAGAVPLLDHEYEHVQAMAAALRRHPVAAALFAPGSGAPEPSLFWIDPATGVWCRARPDWLPHATPDRRLIVPDYKTTPCADPDYLSRAMHQFGYYGQADWYLTAVQALGLSPGGEPAFVLVCQEKTSPYLVTICEPDADALRWGRARNRKARDVYRRCRDAGVWPGYADDVITLSLPGWAEYQHAAAEERGDYDIPTE